MIDIFPTAFSDPSFLTNNGLVAGKFRESGSKKEFPVYEPSTGNVLQSCANMTKEDFIEAIESANADSEKFFTTTTAKARGKILRKWYDLILQYKDDRTYNPFQKKIHAKSFYHAFQWPR